MGMNGTMAICDICGCALKSELALKTHNEIRHSGVIQEECAVCGAKYFEKQFLKMHYSRRHPEFQTEWNQMKETKIEVLPPKQS